MREIFVDAFFSLLNYVMLLKIECFLTFLNFALANNFGEFLCVVTFSHDDLYISWNILIFVLIILWNEKHSPVAKWLKTMGFEPMIVSSILTGAAKK